MREDLKVSVERLLKEELFSYVQFNSFGVDDLV